MFSFFYQNPAPLFVLWILKCVCVCVCSRVCTCVLVAQSCPTLCNPMDYSSPGSSAHGIVQVRILGVGCHSLFQGIFPNQGLNLGLLYCRQILYHLKPLGKPILKCTFLYFSNTPHLFLSHRLSVQYYLTKKSPFSRLPHYPLLTLLTGITSVSHFICCCLHRSKSDVH